MRGIFKFFRQANPSPQSERKVLEKKAVQGAKKAVKEYRRVFERLAEYDRT